MSENLRPAFTFQLNWQLSLASVIFFPILLLLGLWQLQRADEKQTILDLWYQQQAMPPIFISGLGQIANTNQPIQIEGIFDKTKYWLLENRFFKGKLGYDVVMPFRAGENEVILVNRGWVPASAYREHLPVFETPSNSLIIQGNLKSPVEFAMLSDKQQSHTWPKRVLELDLALMNQQYQAEFYKKLVHLELASAGALKVSVQQPVNITPAKHRAYAFQWFSMAFALSILWLISNSNIVKVFKG